MFDERDAAGTAPDPSDKAGHRRSRSGSSLPGPTTHGTSWPTVGGSETTWPCSPSSPPSPQQGHRGRVFGPGCGHRGDGGVGLLRRRLERSLGADADVVRGTSNTSSWLDETEDRAAELEAANGLRHDITGLKAELREAASSLEAARLANRDLMNLLNRS
ncbi:MAG: hypothetical protein M3066_17930 [Actinomycetota bacterium]|nr:hypothetical protein [Actinomycetota bacterium]